VSALDRTGPRSAPSLRSTATTPALGRKSPTHTETARLFIRSRLAKSAFGYRFSIPMKLFECQNCGQLLYFENTLCESCGLRLGYLPDQQVVTALHQADAGAWHSLAAPSRLYRFCANAQHDVCNWMIGIERADVFCAACRHNRTIPDLAAPQNLLHWRKIESAKHRLFYTLLKLRLPLTTRPQDPNGLAFDFLSAPPSGAGARVVTGHAGGLITLNIAEADDLERERQRKSLGEPYRTLLGHFRHEIAHYFWDHLVANSPAIEEFRQLFGDDWAVLAQRRTSYRSGRKASRKLSPPTDHRRRESNPYCRSRLAGTMNTRALGWRQASPLQ
jgi:hypothetical protein